MCVSSALVRGHEYAALDKRDIFLSLKSSTNYIFLRVEISTTAVGIGK